MTINGLFYRDVMVFGEYEVILLPLSRFVSPGWFSTYVVANEDCFWQLPNLEPDLM